MKKRKPRTTGSNLDYDVSHTFGRPHPNTIASSKMYLRLQKGLCIACGKETCECKSGYPEGPDWKNDPYVMNNFWKKISG